MREWFAALRDRSNVAKVLRAEGIVVESLFLLPSAGGDAVIFYVRAMDLQTADAAFVASSHPVDVETRAFMAECWYLGQARVLEPLYDVDRIADTAGPAGEERR